MMRLCPECGLLHCHWCGTPLRERRETFGERASLQRVTRDHLPSRFNRPPNSRGRTVPACAPCNNGRGHDDTIRPYHERQRING